MENLVLWLTIFSFQNDSLSAVVGRQSMPTADHVIVKAVDSCLNAVANFGANRYRRRVIILSNIKDTNVTVLKQWNA